MMKNGSRSWLGVLAMLAVSGLCGCGGDDGGPPDPSGLDTPEAYTSRGWDRFEDGNSGGALDDFQDALDLDVTNGPALAGLGWTQLVRADTLAEMQAAVTSFEAAVAQGETGAYVMAGKAAARLGAGVWTGAAADAQAALVASPGFVFAHRTSFTSNDLFLIIAVAKASAGDLDDALTAADTIQDSGIDSGLPATWVVGGTTYGTYAAAVLAHLQALSEAHAG